MRIMGGLWPEGAARGKGRKPARWARHTSPLAGRSTCAKRTAGGGGQTPGPNLSSSGAAPHPSVAARSRRLREPACAGHPPRERGGKAAPFLPVAATRTCPLSREAGKSWRGGATRRLTGRMRPLPTPPPLRGRGNGLRIPSPLVGEGSQTTKRTRTPRRGCPGLTVVWRRRFARQRRP